MSIDKKIEEIKEKFEAIDGWEERYKVLIMLGKDLSPMNPEYKEEKFIVKGCQSQVWLYPEFIDGVVKYSADSDALIVKGIVSLLIHVYSGQEPDVIVNHKPDFLKELGISDHLSMNRTNGLASIVKSIKMYAFAFSLTKS